MSMFKSTDAKSPEEFIAKIDESRRSEIQKLHDLIRETVPTLEPTMEFGMLGYGTFHYKYASGREGDWCKIGLANNKNYISLYVCAVKDGNYIAELYKDKLPKASTGKSCIRFKKTADIDLDVLRELLIESKDLGFSF